MENLNLNQLEDVNGGVNGWQVAAVAAGGVIFAFAPVIGAAVYAGATTAAGAAGLGAALGSGAAGATIIDEALKWK